MVKEFENKNINKEINTRNARIWLDQEGIIRVVHLPNFEKTLEDAEVNCQAVIKIAKNKKRTVLIYPANDGLPVSRNVRIYYIKTAPQFAITVAALVKSPLTQVLASFLLAMNKNSIMRTCYLRF